MALTAILACTTKCRISSMPIQAPPHGRGASQMVLPIVHEADRVRYSRGFARVPDVRLTPLFGRCSFFDVAFFFAAA